MCAWERKSIALFNVVSVINTFDMVIFFFNSTYYVWCHSHPLPDLESQVANIFSMLKAVLTLQLSNMLPMEHTTGEMCDKLSFLLEFLQSRTSLSLALEMFNLQQAKMGILNFELTLQ